jgi:hypothetical protein
MKHSDSIAELASALAAAQAEYVAVPKNKTARVKMKSGGEYSYKYADLADILSMALPVLSRQGIAFSQPHVLVDGKLRVVSYLLHKSGEWIHSDGIEISELGEPQQMGAESTYFRRYDGASLLGIAPDEDTDAQDAGKRTPRHTNQVQESHYEAPQGEIYTNPPAQPATQQTAQAPAPSQGQAGQLKFLPPNGMIATVKSVKEIEGREASEGHRAIKPFLAVEWLGTHNGVSGASCFDSKYWPLIKASVGLECHFQIKEKDSNGKHYINIEDVIYRDGQEVTYVEGVLNLDGQPTQL